MSLISQPLDQSSRPTVQVNYLLRKLKHCSCFKIGKVILEAKVEQYWTVVVAPVVEDLLLTPGICSSNPVVDNFYLLSPVLKRQK